MSSAHAAAVFKFIPFKREEAWKKMQPVLDARPDLAASAEQYKKYFAGRR